MGRRKKAVKKVVKKKKFALSKVFKCIFCNHDQSVQCKMDSRSMIGELNCSICDAKFQTQINTLSEPIDVFTEWLDETSNLQAEVIEKELPSNRISHHEDSGDEPEQEDFVKEEDEVDE